MTSLPERQQYVAWWREALEAGARKHPAAEVLGLSLRTLQRWLAEPQLSADGRPDAVRPTAFPCLESRGAAGRWTFAIARSLPRCHRVKSYHGWPIWGVTWPVSRASIASCGSLTSSTDVAGVSHRVMCRYQPAIPRPDPIKCGPGISPTCRHSVRGQYYYLYLIEDIYSRKGVGWEVHEQECGEHAAALLQRSVIREQCWKQPLVLHSDNGAPMKSVTLLTKMHDLGITPSRGRPRVSNDNPYSESLFRTLKYCPQWPSDGFASLDAAREWVRDFMTWYNDEHRHSRIRLVTPSERHRGEDKALLAKRDAVYQAAQARHPARWSRNNEKLGAYRCGDAESGAARTRAKTGGLKQVYATTILKNAGSIGKHLPA